MLIAVLAFSPLAANMHIASHFHDCEGEVAATSADCETVHNKAHFTVDGPHSFASHSDDKHSDSHSKSSGIATDCAIYHVYAGLTGCLSAILSMSALHAHGMVNSVAKIDGFAAEAVDRLRIRGPPQLS